MYMFLIQDLGRYTNYKVNMLKENTYFNKHVLNLNRMHCIQNQMALKTDKNICHKYGRHEVNITNTYRNFENP